VKRSSSRNKWCVYILKCGDGSLYTGITNDLKKRFEAHKSGKGSKFVRSRKAKKIVHIESYKTKSKALKREAAIKGYSRHKKLELLK
jgi:putative endonuclease